MQIFDSTTYNPDGQVASLRLDEGSNGGHVTYTYETGTRRLQQVQGGSIAGGSMSNMLDLTYSYDNAGNITSISCQ